MKRLLHKHGAGLLLLTGLQWVISVADWMLIVLLQIVVFDLTQSAFNIMLLVICELIPMLLFGAWAGAVADRTDLKRVLVWACVARLFIILALLLPAMRGQLIPILAIAALAATCNRFFVPGASALLPSLVSADRLPAANAIIMAARMSGMAIGTLLAGVLASHYGHVVAVVVIGVLLLIASVLCVLLPSSHVKREQADEVGIWRDLRTAVSRYGASLILPMTASMLVMLALGSFEILALVYVVQVLERPPADVGLLFGAYGVGMLAGLALSSWPRVGQQYGAWMLISLTLICASIWVVSKVDSLGLALPLVAVTGLAEGLVITLSLLRIYQQVAGDFYARVIALLDTGTGAAFLVSVMLTGVVADKVPANILLQGLAMTLTGLLLLGVIVMKVSTAWLHLKKVELE